MHHLFDPLSPLMPLRVAGWMWMGWMFYWVFSAQFALKQKKREGIARIQHTIPTMIGIVSVFHVLWEPAWLGYFTESIPVRWCGLVLVVGGHLFSVWARLHLGKYWSGTVALKYDHKLIATGPYALVRHPIYTGLLAAILGSAIAGGSWEGLAGFAVMIPAYMIKWKREEKLLIGELGQEYRDYMAKTRAIVPFIF